MLQTRSRARASPKSAIPALAGALGVRQRDQNALSTSSLHGSLGNRCSGEWRTLTLVLEDGLAATNWPTAQ
jgi:hypothetical protein